MTPRYADAPRRSRTGRSADPLATGLGWFSIALGAVQLAFPQAVARCLGSSDEGQVMRAYGARELVTGIGILGSDDPRPWVWGRVAGDVLDLATLSLGLRSDNPRRTHVATALASVAAITAIDLLCARSLDEAERGVYVAPDYSDRSGFPRPPSEMRGAARRQARTDPPKTDPAISPNVARGAP